jgi:hypothetical protein
MEKEQQSKKKTSVVTWLVLIVFVIIIAVVIDTASDAGPRVNDSVTTEVVDRCLSVPEVVVERLNSGLNINGGGEIRNLKAVKSNSFESVYFISGDLQGAGLEGNTDIATYATNKLDYTGLTLSVDAVAVEFSDWPDVKTTNLGVSIGDEGYFESRECVTDSM